MSTIAVIRIANQYNNEGDCLPRTIAKSFPSDAPLSRIWDWVNSVSGGPEQRLLLSGPELSQQEDEPTRETFPGPMFGPVLSESRETPGAPCNPPFGEDDCPF